ncbi:hypothetical protein LZC95_18285 [Pendulispora brunnea]|uniref:Uncharacterized protein n=1 Tax=Pendulispora brunnea TaxID=2905690 RepID=A0ABZ2KQZ9_9BACT
MATSGRARGPTQCRDAVGRLDSVGIRGEGRPRAVYGFDMRVTNPAGGPRWLVFPETFPREGRQLPAPGRGTVERLEAVRLAGRGRVIAVHAAGAGGFRAIYLPPGAKAVLNELPILADWTMPYATAKIEVIVAHEILIDDVPLSSWIQGSLVAGPDSDVSLASDPSAQLELAKPLAAGGHTVTIQDDCRTTAQAILKHEDF